MARQEDFVFAERVLQHGYATEEQVQECLSLLDRLRAEMKIEESLQALMVKKGYLAPAQVHVLEAEIDPGRAAKPKNMIEGYRLLERLGSGAMGSVYKAHHSKLDIPVALKVLRPSLASSRTQIERLRREAQLAARLNHVNVVRSLDVGESNGFHYLAMEFVEGRTARDLLGKGPLPEKDALGIVRQVAAGLAHAHAQGVVHRDVKPGNILITGEGTAKLADFGLARGQAPSDLTLEQASIGTPQYVAPEQMRRGSDATPRSDLFSLGSTLYHMLTGRPPFDGENLGEIVQNVLACRFRPPEAVAPSLSRDAVYVLGRLMRANPRERYASAAELVADLDRIGQGGPVAPADFLGDYQAFLRKRRGRRNAILAACAGVLVCAGAYWWRHDAARRERTEFDARCAAAADAGADVDTATTLDDLEAAVRTMETAEAAAGACDPAVLEPLRRRLGRASEAKRFLRQAEDALSDASKDGADYRGLDSGLAVLESGLPRIDRRISEIRDEIARLSEKAASARSNRLPHDATEAMREARAFAADLENRYLGFDAPWTEAVRSAPRFLDAFDTEWKSIDGIRGEFEEALGKGRFGVAAARLATITEQEEAARRGLFRNAYLARSADLFSGPDERATRLRDAETTTWGEVLEAARSEMQATPPRPDRAARRLADFLEVASPWTHALALKQHDLAMSQLEAIDTEQGVAYATDEARFRRLVAERAYAKAYEEISVVAASPRWLDKAAAKYRALLDRADAVAKLTSRFLDGCRAQKTVTIRKGVEVLGDIEVAPGENPDRFVGRRGKERFEFTLADFEDVPDLKEQGERSAVDRLRRIFAFDPNLLGDQALSGWFHAAEAFRVEATDPYKARDLRKKARVELSRNDPWLPDVEAALTATEERIANGERRAEQAAAELKAAKDSGDASKYPKQLSLLRELLALGWTRFAGPRKAEYSAEYASVARFAKGELLPLEFGVPGRNIRYDKERNLSILFTGEDWCPAPDAPPDQADKLTKAHWDDWFRNTKGKTDENEIADLTARARTQRLAWSGPVEVGPKGGYLPGAEALILDIGEDWMPPLGAAGFVARKPLPIFLAFPFRRDQPWAIEITVRWPTPEPGYFALSCGQIQAVFGYFKGEFAGGGMRGACLVESDSMEPGTFVQLLDLQWRLVEEKEGRRSLTGEKAYIDHFDKGKPYRMRLQRTRDSVIFEMWPLDVPRDRQETARIRVEKRYADARKLDKLVTLDDGRTVFRFFGAPPGKGLAYELRDVEISGSLSEKADVD